MKSDEQVKYEEFIHDRGRGPEIKGTRITVYAILDYVLLAWHPDVIAADFRLSSDQVRAAIDYINDHTLEVLREYVKMLERAERGNPPELRAKIEENHQRFQLFKSRLQEIEDTDPDIRRAKVAILMDEYRRAGKQGDANAGDNGGS